MSNKKANSRLNKSQFEYVDKTEEHLKTQNMTSSSASNYRPAIIEDAQKLNLRDRTILENMTDIKSIE